MQTPTRRAFLHSSAAAAAALVACTAGDTEDGGAPVNPTWEDRAADLEATGLHTREDPGPWAGKEDGHVPMFMDQTATTVTICTEHDSDPDHYVTTHYVRDQDGVIVGLREYQPGDFPLTTFSLPEGTTEVTAYSNCNMHEVWRSVAIPIF